VELYFLLGIELRQVFYHLSRAPSPFFFTLFFFFFFREDLPITLPRLDMDHHAQFDFEIGS
jgi:hypothetical protein